VLVYREDCVLETGVQLIGHKKVAVVQNGALVACCWLLWRLAPIGLHVGYVDDLLASVDKLLLLLLLLLLLFFSRRYIMDQTVRLACPARHGRCVPSRAADECG